MRFAPLALGLVLAIFVSACDTWPTELGPLADSITQQAGGDATAWRVGGDVVVIDVANSPAYRSAVPELEALATEFAGQAVGASDTPLESIVVTFHEGDVSDDPGKQHEFIFLVLDDRPVLQPPLDPDATGPLTAGEIRAAMARIDEAYESLGEPLSEEHRECVLAEMERRARDAGDPETLDPETVELLATKSWYGLDAFGKRLVLAQAITTKALFACAGSLDSGEKP